MQNKVDKRGKNMRNVKQKEKDIETTVEDVVLEAKPKLFGVATCQLTDENGVVLLEQGEEAEIIGETEDMWQIEAGFVSKKFILKKYK
jgi:outer membrane receptor for ferric coprogen and ferric-rhodotorulic acid